MLPYNCYIEKNSYYEDNTFIFYENSIEDRIWDIVVVYEGVYNDCFVRVKKGGLWFISGEPPMSREYPSSFLRLFDIIITSHKYHHNANVINWQQALDWHFCKSFVTKKNKFSLKELEYMPLPYKSKLISIISSSKKMMPGHKYRQDIINKLKRDFGDKIDFFGGNDGNVEYKCDAIMPYKFHICIENSNINDYWTEKLADSFLGYSIPIYSGCTNVERYFNNNGMFRFDIKHYEGLKKIIESILQAPEDVYDNKKEALLQNRQKLFSNYHLFKTIQLFYDKYKLHLQDANDVVYIKKMSHYKGYFYERNKIRLKRFCVGLYINIKFRLQRC